MIALLEDDAKQELHNSYMATCVTVLAKLVAVYFGNDWDLPSYYELMHPEQKPEDDRTAEEIRQHVLELFEE